MRFSLLSSLAKNNRLVVVNIMAIERAVCNNLIIKSIFQLKTRLDNVNICINIIHICFQ